jgi:hypothetical protein
MAAMGTPEELIEENAMFAATACIRGSSAGRWEVGVESLKIE